MRRKTYSSPVPSLSQSTEISTHRYAMVYTCSILITSGKSVNNCLHDCDNLLTTCNKLDGNIRLNNSDADML